MTKLTAPPAPADETTKDKGQPATAPQTWAAYVRVSTETQAKKKDQNGDVHGTHENQVEALTAWARAAGVRIELYQDPGVTGKDGQNVRGPIFQQMTADLALKNLAGVVVTAVDRLGRETLDLLTVYRQFRDLGKSLLSLKEGDQKLENDDALMREILAVMASEERRRTAKRMGDGFRRKIAQGWKPGREPKAINWKDAQRLLDAGASVAVCARAFGLTRTQFWRRMQAQGVINPNSRPFGKSKAAERNES
jgi:DNA invertase Pin-like site-specific DNA recombinase